MPMLKLVGQSSVITLHLEHPIHLDDAKNYRLALCGFYSDNNICNLPRNANVYFWMGTDNAIRTLTLERGHYTLDSLQELCRGFIKSIDKNLNSNKFTISKAKNGTNVSVVSPLKFTFDSTMRKLLGFGRPQTDSLAEEDEEDEVDGYNNERNYFEADKMVIGSFPPNLRAVDTVEIQCNLVENSYSNHFKHTHKHQEHRILYNFFPAVPRGFKISETPRERYYAPLDNQLKVIQTITVSIVDQDNRPLRNPSANNIVYLDLKRII